jgi:imidazolonepropionase-like amidohydrolase
VSSGVSARRDSDSFESDSRRQAATRTDQKSDIPSEVLADRIPTIKTGGNVFIHGGKVMTITQGVIDGGDVLILNGKIAKVGKNLAKPDGVTQIDATGMFVTPGLVDPHSHRAEDEVNEWADSITAEVRIQDILDPQATGLFQALASGITTNLILHGSANPIGGQSVVIKNRWRQPVENLIFKGAPRMIKFALGENPRGVNGRGSNDPIRFAQTRLGVAAVYRRAFADAKDYMKAWDEYDRLDDKSKTAPPRRDLRLETLADILKGKIWVQCHSYRQDEMLMMVRLSQEFGFHLVLQHALEAYKIAPELAAAHVPVSTFGDGFVYKLEVVDSMPMSTAICDLAGVLTSVNTDTDSGLAPLSQDAGRALRYGMSEDHAMRMLTINGAMELGVDKRVGSIEPGKDGDVAIWQGHPLSVYSKCQYALVDGAVEFQRRDAFHVKTPQAAAASVAAKAFEPDAPVLPAAKSYLIEDATVHPVSGPDVEHGYVLIVDDKIKSVGASRPALSAGTVIVPGKGKHVYPGLIDSGSLLGLSEIGEVPQAIDTPENGDFLTDMKAVTSVNPESVHFPQVRFNGITNTLVRPLGSMFDGQASLIHTAGFTTELMTVEGSAAMAVEIPSGVDEDARATAQPEALEKLENNVKDRRRQIREYFELAKRYGEAVAAHEPIATDTKLEALQPFLTGKKPVIFYSADASAIRYSLRLSKQLGLKAIIGGGREAWKVAGLLAESHVPVILDPPQIACPGEDNPATPMDPYDSMFASAAVLRQAGVTVAFSSESFDGAMDLPYRVGRMCAFGLTHDDAIRGLTLDAAKTLGLANLLGSLEAGKMANIIVTDGDPLELTTNVRYEFINGLPVSLKTHYTELYKKYSFRAKQFLLAGKQ